MKNQNNRGSALLIVLILSVSIAGIFVGLTDLARTSSIAAFEGNRRTSRLYSAESGLERVKMLVSENGRDWLTDNAGDSAVTWSEGTDFFMVSDHKVQVKLTDLGDGWCYVASTSTDLLDGATTVGSTVRGAVSGEESTVIGYWCDYARFVSKGQLNIGSNATYGGKVHCNSNINAVGGNVTFMDDVTAAGKISPYTSRRNPDQNTTFMKNSTAGVDTIELPDGEELESRWETAPEGALVYNAKSAEFIEKVKSYDSDYVASDDHDVRLEIEFKNNVMDVVTRVYATKNSKTPLVEFTEVELEVPDDKSIYVSGETTVSGDISGRTSVVTPEDIRIEGALRYVDDDGEDMWQLRNKATGEVDEFNEDSNSWSTQGNWSGSEMEYVIADDWDSRATNADRTKPPVLGLMSGSTIYIDGEHTNREIHAALFSSGDVVRSSGGKKGNLYINGAIITTGTNPVSSFFSYRTYAYDPNLRENPAPDFEMYEEKVGEDVPPIPAAFTNWHIVQE